MAGTGPDCIYISPHNPMLKHVSDPRTLKRIEAAKRAGVWLFIPKLPRNGTR
jgi:hypothetical protein